MLTGERQKTTREFEHCLDNLSKCLEQIDTLTMHIGLSATVRYRVNQAFEKTLQAMEQLEKAEKELRQP